MKPTFGQLEHFFRLVAEGKVTLENFQPFLESPDYCFEHCGFPVSVDYSKSLAEMIDAATNSMRNWGVHPNVTAEHYEVEGKGKVDFNLRLVYIESPTTEEAERFLATKGLGPARVEHLIAFGARYPEVHKHLEVLALGGRRSRFCDVAYLSRDGGAPTLMSIHWDHLYGRWVAIRWFLAIELSK